MSGPVFAIRVPPRLQEVISPTIKDVKSSGQHAKNRRCKVGMRVRMTGAGREYVWGRIGTQDQGRAEKWNLCGTTLRNNPFSYASCVTTKAGEPGPVPVRLTSFIYTDP